jgi:adenylate kinase
MNILMIGVQGSGKGTQGRLLAKKLGIPHVSTGDLCRDTDESTQLGKKVRKYMNAGELVPIELITELLKNRLKQDDTKKGVILEGYPRFIDQAKLLEEFLKLDKVFLIDISDEEALSRISGRRVCSNTDCQAIYNVNTAPRPKKEGVCDKCGSPLKQRSDETEESVKRRIEIYHEETEPLIQYYKDEGILIEINGEQSIDDVQAEIQTKLNKTKEN